MNSLIFRRRSLMLILFQLQTLQRIYELLGLNGEDMKRESLQLWDMMVATFSSVYFSML